MLTLPAEISTNKNKINMAPVIAARFMSTIYFHAASRTYKLQNLETGTDAVVSVAGGVGTITCASATWQTWGVRVGDEIEITVPFTETYTVTAVNSQTQVAVTGNDRSQSGCTWGLSLNFDDAFKSKLNLSLNSNVNELINSQTSQGGLKLNLVDWVDVLRGAIVGTSPNLTDKQIDLLFALAINTSYTDDWIKIFDGRISNYEIKNDIMSIDLKPKVVLGQFPSTLLSAQYSGSEFDIIEHESDICMPLQLGRFDDNYETPNKEYSDVVRQWAIIPMVYYSEDELRYCVAGHQLHSVQGTSGTNLNSVLTTYYSGVGMRGCFKRDDAYIFYGLGTTGSTWANNTNESLITHYRTGAEYGIIRFAVDEVLENTNTVANPEYTYDKDTSTYAVVTIRIATRANKFANMGSSTLIAAPNAYLYVSAGTITGGSGYNVYAVDPSGTKTSIGLTASATTVLGLSTPSNVQELAEWEFGVERITGSGTVQIKEIWVRAYVNGPTNLDKFFYLSGVQGKAYSGTWGGRKTSGNAIYNPSDSIECILRDVFGYDSEIDPDTFDEANTIYGGNGARTSPATVEIAYTVFRKIDLTDFLDDWCKAFNAAVTRTAAGNWRYIVPKFANRNFSSSGSSNPNNEDIFVDSDTFVDFVYTQQPIVKDSFRLWRSSENDVYGLITMQVYTDEDESPLDVLIQGTAGEKNFDITNLYLPSYVTGSTTRGANLLAIIDGWLFNQKWVVEFNTFYNAIAKEVGDVINLRHLMINDNMLVSTENLQKWCIIDMSHRWHPNLIRIKVIELRD